MLQYASVTGLIRTILIIVLIYFGLKVLARLFGPFLFRYAAKKAEKQFNDKFGNFQKEETKSKVGETIIDKVPNQKSSNKDVGEYVDYEEID